MARSLEETSGQGGSVAASANELVVDQRDGGVDRTGDRQRRSLAGVGGGQRRRDQETAASIQQVTATTQEMSARPSR